MLRELIVGEAMHALGVPTTRTLAVVTTGSSVWRDNIEMPGAIQTRIAKSHIRVGTFQYFAARGDIANLKRLADYTIERLYPETQAQENRYLAFFESVLDRQAKLLSSWLCVGFIHGVMNTDNMAISGETIDYGPCAFLDEYDAKKVFSSIDHQGRYAFENQPPIAQWNLIRLAETLLPLLNSDSTSGLKRLEELIVSFAERFDTYWLDGMRKKLGLIKPKSDDLKLVQDLLENLQNKRADYTNAFTDLGKNISKLEPTDLNFVESMWLKRWQERLRDEGRSLEACHQTMQAANPVYIPRNHRIAEVINSAVNHQDFSKLEKLMRVLATPYIEQPDDYEFTLPPKPEEVVEQTFCGT
jgi:uncharacterized protein YdiU (UPF0061 family)